MALAQQPLREVLDLGNADRLYRATDDLALGLTGVGPYAADLCFLVVGGRYVVQGPALGSEPQG